MQFIATEKSQQNVAAVDPWTFVHLGAGLALGLINVPFRWDEFVEQVFQQSDRVKEFFETHTRESLPNAVVDSAAFAAGQEVDSKGARTM